MKQPFTALFFFKCLTLLFFCIAMSLLASCAQQKQPNSILDQAVPQHKQAVAIYRAQCMGCHGNDLEGRSAPSIQQIGAIRSKEQLISIITEGIIQRGMPSFEQALDKTAIDHLSEWLSKLQ